MNGEKPSANFFSDFTKKRKSQVMITSGQFKLYFEAKCSYERRVALQFSDDRLTKIPRKLQLLFAGFA